MVYPVVLHRTICDCHELGHDGKNACELILELHLCKSANELLYTSRETLQPLCDEQVVSSEQHNNPSQFILHHLNEPAHLVARRLRIHRPSIHLPANKPRRHKYRSYIPVNLSQVSQKNITYL